MREEGGGSGRGKGAVLYAVLMASVAVYFYAVVGV